MMLHNRVRSLCAVLAASAVFAFSAPAFSQDVTESHLKAARAAVAAIHATDPFDNILPQAAAALESQLIQKNRRNESASTEDKPKRRTTRPRPTA